MDRSSSSAQPSSTTCSDPVNGIRIVGTTAQQARSARACWAVGHWAPAETLRAVRDLLDAGDRANARWLLLRFLDTQAALSLHQLARALLHRIAPDFAPPQTSDAPGTVRLTGRAVVGRVRCPNSPCSIDVEIDGRHLQVSLDASEDATSATGVRSFQLRVPTNARVIRVSHRQTALQGSPLVLTHTPYPCPPPARPAPDVWVLIPVHDGAAAVRRCIDSVLTAVNRTSSRVLIVDDASKDPDLCEWLRAIAVSGRIALVRRPVNGGFSAAVNSGLRLTGAQDTILLNSDTLVSDGWIDRLRTAAWRAPDIGAVNPLSNHAELLSIPTPMSAGPMPDQRRLGQINDLLVQRHAGQAVVVPAGVGFCWYLRGDALADVGLLDEAMVRSGYAEDTELSVRLQRHGWRLVAALDTYVAHQGSVSFGTAKPALAARNVALMRHRFPEHGIAYRRFLTDGALRPLARELQRALLPSARVQGDRLLLCDAQRWRRRQRLAPAPGWALIPHWEADGAPSLLSLVADGVAGIARIDYALPAQADELRQDIIAAGFAALHRETFANWTTTQIDTVAALPVIQTACLSDASAYCPRRHANDTPRRRCDEPADLAACETCVAIRGPLQRGIGTLAEWRASTRAALRRSNRIAATSADLAVRLSARLEHPVTGPMPTTTPIFDDARAQRIAFIGLDDFGSGFALVADLARTIDARSETSRLVVIGRSLDDRRLARHHCVELPGDLPDVPIDTALRQLDCDAIADPGFSADPLIADLAARMRLPLLDRAVLSCLLGPLAP